jgi:phage I-like protein
MKNSLLVYSLAAQGQPAEWVRILPEGKVALREGDSRQPFEVTAAAMNLMVQRFRDNKIDLVVDYEHQSLGPGKAPAAGWIKDLEARADGLYARIDWTATALQFLREGEYRYYSPVLMVDPKTRQPFDLKSMALTNTPALNGAHLAPLLAAKYGDEGEVEILDLRDFNTGERKRAAEEGSALPDGSFPIKDRADISNAIHDYGRAQDKAAAQKHIIARAKALNCMDLLPADWPGSTKKSEEATAMLKDLILKFGLKPEATEAEVLAQVDSREQEAVALKAQVAALPEIATALGLSKPAEATPAQIKGAVLALKAGQDQLTTLQSEVAVLKAETAQDKAETAVAAALTAGKITPPQRAWALKYAGDDPAGFASYVATATKVVPVHEPLKVKLEGGQETVLAPEEAVICKAMSLTPEAFKAQQVKEQAQKEARK